MVYNDWGSTTSGIETFEDVLKGLFLSTGVSKFGSSLKNYKILHTC
jgi:hypothetical protein